MELEIVQSTISLKRRYPSTVGADVAPTLPAWRSLHSLAGPGRFFAAVALPLRPFTSTRSPASPLTHRSDPRAGHPLSIDVRSAVDGRENQALAREGRNWADPILCVGLRGVAAEIPQVATNPDTETAV